LPPPLIRRYCLFSRHFRRAAMFSPPKAADAIFITARCRQPLRHADFRQCHLMLISRASLAFAAAATPDFRWFSITPRRCRRCHRLFSIRFTPLSPLPLLLLRCYYYAFAADIFADS